LVLDLVSGGDLFDKISESEIFSEKEASGIIRQILEAVEYLHSNGIVHRDLKVDNILCSDELDSEGNLQIFVADFGLSRFFDPEAQQLQSRVGSLEYTAPEVFAAKPYEKSCDLWSIGIVSYILLTGLFPFADKNPVKLYEKINKVDYNWDECPEVSNTAKEFISGLLTKDPNKRMNATQALQHEWINPKNSSSSYSKVSRTESLVKFGEKMKNLKEHAK